MILAEAVGQDILLLFQELRNHPHQGVNVLTNPMTDRYLKFPKCFVELIMADMLETTLTLNYQHCSLYYQLHLQIYRTYFKPDAEQPIMNSVQNSTL